MHEHIVPVSKSANTGSVLNNLMMSMASFPFIACTLDTVWSEVLRSSSHSVKNKLSSSFEFDSELRSWNRMPLIAS